MVSPTASATTALRIVSFTANPAAIVAGQTTTLAWSIDNATSASLAPGIGAVNPSSGSISVTPFQTTTYTLSAIGPTGTVSTTLTVVVGPRLSPGQSAQPMQSSTNTGARLTGTSLPHDQTNTDGSSTTAVALTITDAAGGTGPVQIQPRCIWLSNDTPAPPANSTDEQVQFRCPEYRSNGNPEDPTTFEMIAQANRPQNFSAFLSSGPRTTPAAG